MNILIENYKLIPKLVVYCYHHDIQLNIISDIEYWNGGELVDDLDFEKGAEIIDKKNGINTNFKGEEYRLLYNNIQSMLKYIPNALVPDNPKYYYLPYIYPFIIKGQESCKYIKDPNVEIVNRDDKDIILNIPLPIGDGFFKITDNIVTPNAQISTRESHNILDIIFILITISGG